MIKNNERYARKDIEGGFLYNKSEIDYFRQVQNVDIATNLMLGDYNTVGNYTIDAGVIEQLVGITKVYQYSFGTTMFCQSLSDIDGFGKLILQSKLSKMLQQLVTQLQYWNFWSQLTKQMDIIPTQTPPKSKNTPPKKQTPLLLMY